MNPDIGTELIPALEKALADYLGFSLNTAPTDIKEFNAYHTACKAALLHIALLMKLTQKETSSVVPDLSILLEQAKKELTPHDLSGISLDLG